MSTVKKINNPFLAHKDNNYNCFGCSPSNNIGFHLEFFGDGENVFCYWNPQKSYEGYANVVHGGIQAALMDEVAAWFTYSMLGTAGVTQGLNVEYHKPLFITGGEVKINASLKEKTGKSALIRTTIVNSKGVICCSADVEYFLFPPQLARTKYMYPGKEKFWE